MGFVVACLTCTDLPFVSFVSFSNLDIYCFCYANLTRLICFTAFGQSSNSSPFGTQTQSMFGQTNNASNNPFAPKPFGSSTPFGAQTGSSMFGGTSTGVFGAPQTSSPFGASSQPFGSSTPAFGASSAPTFGSSTSPFGGTYLLCILLRGFCQSFL